MLRQARFLTLGAFIAAVCFAYPASADDAAIAGRTLLQKNKKAVVTVSLVIKFQFSMPGSGSQEREQKSEVTGTIIDPTGLTVLSLSQTDPTSIMGDMGDSGMKIESVLSDVKMLMDDDTELSAKVVLRDKDLDLAFIRPTEPPSTPFTAVNLSDATTPGALDQILLLNRLGKVANRVYSVSVDRVEAIITKPRTFYVPSQTESNASLGSPAFSLDGKIIGIALLRSLGHGMGGGMGSIRDNTIPVILPAADILEAGKQAPAAKDVKEQPKPSEKPAAPAKPAPKASDATAQAPNPKTQ